MAAVRRLDKRNCGVSTPAECHKTLVWLAKGVSAKALEAGGITLGETRHGFRRYAIALYFTSHLSIIPFVFSSM